MCRERSETGSSPKRIEQNACYSLIGEISWRFGAKSSAIRRNMFGDSEKKCSAILEKTCSAILEKTCSAIWRNSFGENIGDLENRGRRSYGNFVLEFVME